MVLPPIHLKFPFHPIPSYSIWILSSFNFQSVMNVVSKFSILFIFICFPLRFGLHFLLSTQSVLKKSLNRCENLCLINSLYSVSVKMSENTSFFLILPFFACLSFVTSFMSIVWLSIVRRFFYYKKSLKFPNNAVLKLWIYFLFHRNEFLFKFRFFLS